jgi:hypothetical protein
MEILIITTLLVAVAVFINQQSLNKKLNDIYTEVAEIHHKMGGWSDGEDDE